MSLGIRQSGIDLRGSASDVVRYGCRDAISFGYQSPDEVVGGWIPTSGTTAGA